MLTKVIVYILLYQICITASVFKVYDDTEEVQDRVKTHNELNKVWTNTICCLKNLRCCEKSEDIQIRAVLVNCGQENKTDKGHYQKMLQLTPTVMHIRRDCQDQPKSHPSIQQCRKKLMLTIKLHTLRKHTKVKNMFLVVDYVSDACNNNVRLLTPYVIKLRQHPLSQMYKIDFQNIVNSNPEEVVFNKNSKDYSGCDTTSSNPTCGKVTYRGRNVPYSEGFCCSCDDYKNVDRQLKSTTDYIEDIVTYGDPAFLLNGNECPKYLRGNEMNDLYYPPASWYQYVNPKVRNIARSVNRVYLNPRVSSKAKFIRQLVDGCADENQNEDVDLNEEQRRGKQNCSDKVTPKGKDPETYHDSTHCLKFSNVWYAVYRLEKPLLEHSLLVQVFERQEDTTGRVFWKDLTKGKMVRVGTTTHNYEDENKLVIRYSSHLKHVHDTTFAINHKNALILVPDGVTKKDFKYHPEVRNGPAEYLVVHNNQIRPNGDTCNVGGVGYEAFAKQPNRCARPRGSCLANQPFKLWLHDYQAEKDGKKGCFFLKNYGSFSENPIRRDPRTKEQYLVMDFPQIEPVEIQMEIRADFNTMLTTMGPAKITEVYVDSTYSFKTIIIVKVTNSGLISSLFATRLASCPLEIPASVSNIESKPTLIPPQHQHTFNLEIQAVLPLNKFHCTVEVLNQNRELIAMRRILIVTLDRCLCTWHCLCACLGSRHRLKCIPMSLQHYHAAGFRGSLPISNIEVKYSFLDDVMTFVMYLIIYFVIALLLLGLLKGLLGISGMTYIGMYGLDVILDLPQPIRQYYERELRQHEIVYDSDGWPIHPRTREKVRCIKQSTELCINLIFFFIYPICLCLSTCRKLRKVFSSQENFRKEDSDHSRKRPGLNEKTSSCNCICCQKRKCLPNKETAIAKKQTSQKEPNVCDCKYKPSSAKEQSEKNIKPSLTLKMFLEGLSDDNGESIIQIYPPSKEIRIKKNESLKAKPANSAGHMCIAPNTGNVQEDLQGSQEFVFVPNDNLEFAEDTAGSPVKQSVTKKSLPKEELNVENVFFVQGNEQAITLAMPVNEIDVLDSVLVKENIVTTSSWTDETEVSDDYEIEH